MTQTFNLKIARDVSWNTEFHWVDASEADQGAAGSGESVKDIVDSVGATKNATMIFSHSGSGNTTTYSFGTDETIPTNIDVIVEAGAQLAIATGVTLTINGPFQANERIKCIALTGTGVVSFGEESVSEVYPEWWGGVADGSTNVSTYISNALNAITRGVVKLAPGVYECEADDIVITGTGKHLIGSGIDATFINGNANDNTFRLAFGSNTTTAQGCSARDFTLSRSTGVVNGHGVLGQNFVNCFVQNLKIRRHTNSVYLASESGYSSASFGFKVLDCHVEETDTVAFFLADEVVGIVIKGNTVGNAAKGGANTLTADYFLYTDSTPDNVVMTENVFSYSAGTAEIGNLTSFTNLSVSGNVGLSASAGVVGARVSGAVDTEYTATYDTIVQATGIASVDDSNWQLRGETPTGTPVAYAEGHYDSTAGEDVMVTSETLTFVVPAGATWKVIKATDVGTNSFLVYSYPIR